MFYFYVLKNKEEELYYGYTKNLKQRIFEHNHKKSKFTSKSIWKIIYYEAFLSEKDARDRESKIKYRGQAIRQLKERIKNSLNQS